ncbi:restriction endonuclease [Priestia megaterium]|uniref:restriction endonuclease n=1 Tax=Priestia megaterium TaxID=1404 RepID=UPI003101111A
MAKLKVNKSSNKNLDISSIVIFCFVMLWGLFYEPKIFIGPFLISFAIIVFLIYIKTVKHKTLVKSDISQIDLMNGVQFEEYLGELFRTMGYKVENTPRSGDYGADLILKKGRRKIAVQAKRYKGRVGISAVQQIIGAKNFYKADDIWVVTNSYYSKPAKNLGAVNNVKLIDREELIKLSQRHLR